MTEKMGNNYREWLDKAQEDQVSAMALLDQTTGSPATVCFLSQQLAEKHLKALLICHNKTFPKVHDLLELETLLLDVEEDVKEIHKSLEFLNRYYVETRYPGDFPEFTWPEAKEAFQFSQKVKDFVLSKVK